MKLACIPREFKTFFNLFRDTLPSKRVFFYFTVYVYGIIIMPKQKKNVTRIAASWVGTLCRSSLEKFLSQVDWDYQKVMKRARRQIYKHISHLPKGKRQLEIILDDTDLDKFGGVVFGIGWYKRRKADIPWKAIQLVVIGIVIGEWFIPMDFRIYVPQKKCEELGRPFQTKLELAREMIQGLKLPREMQVQFKFDSWYLNSKVTEPSEKRGWKWYSRCRKNRKVRWEEVEDNEEKEVNLENYVKGVEFQELNYQTQRKRRIVVGHQRIGELNKIGRVNLVITRFDESKGERTAFCCTNDFKSPMASIVHIYERRWYIEVYFRESRAYLALEHWFFHKEISVVRHLCLSIVAMIACVCIRLSELEKGEVLGTLGEFVESKRKQNQRLLFSWFFEQFHLEKMTGEDRNKFDALCDQMDL